MRSVLVTAHGAGLQPTAGSTVFTYTGMSFLASNATEANRQALHREAGTISRLRVRVPTNISTGSSTVTLRIGGVDKSLTLSIATVTTGLFEDVTHSEAVAAGNLVGWKLVCGATTSPVFASVCAEFAATTETKAITAFATTHVVPVTVASTTVCLTVTGRTANSVVTTEVWTQQPSPAAGTLRNFYAYVSANARTATTFRVRKNTANGNGTFSVGSSATGQFEDAVNTDTIAVGDLINKIYITGTGVASISIESVGSTFDSTTAAICQTATNSGTSFSTASTSVFPVITGDLGTTFGWVTESSAQTKSLAGIYSRLSAYLSANARTTASTIALRVNGVSSALTMSLTASTTGLFQDTTHSVTTVADDLVNYVVTAGLGTGTTTVHFIGSGFAPPLVISGSQVSETDTANAGTLSIVRPGTQAAETDTANAGTPKIVVAGSLVAETDTANAGAIRFSKVGAQPTETDTANDGLPIIRVGGALPTETDTANAGSPQIVVTGSQATETDTANAGTISFGRPGALVSETDTAGVGTPSIVVFGNQAVETDTAVAGTALHGVVVVGNQAVETDTGLAGMPAIVVAGNQATEGGAGTSSGVCLIGNRTYYRTRVLAHAL